MTASRETEIALSRQPTEGKEREFNRTGVVVVLAIRDPETQKASVFVVEHNVNLIKGIRQGDLGLPCETIEPGEQPTQTARRLFVEEIGINPDKITAYIQKDHEHLDLKLPQRGVQANIVVMWLMNINQFNGVKPEDSKEIKRGFFVPVDQLIHDPNLQLRENLNPSWFLAPLIQQDFLSPNGGYKPARLNEIMPLRPTQ